MEIENHNHTKLIVLHKNDFELSKKFKESDDMN